MYTIYRHISVVTGKSYVGYTLTKKSSERRWLEHCKCAEEGSNLVFHQAIRKHGKDSWIHEILQKDISPDEVIDIEKFWIKECRSHYSEFGYNMTYGGDGCVGVLVTEETRRKMSESRKGKNHSEISKNKMREKATGRSLASSSKEKVGIATLERFSDPLFKEKHSNRTREAMKNLNEDVREKLRNRRRPVGKFTKEGLLLERFESVSQAAQSVGVTTTAISACARGKSSSCKGYQWRYMHEEKEE